MSRFIFFSFSILFSFNCFANVDLEKAYQQEYIFLKNQLEALKKRKQRLETSETKRIEKMEKEIVGLKRNVSRAFSRNELLKDQISSFDKDLQEKDQIVDRVNAINAQMAETLGPVDLDKSSIQKIETYVEKALNKLYQQRGISKKTGKFFTPLGEEMEGSVLKVGGIAAYAQNKGKWGILDKVAGSSSLKLLDTVSLSSKPEFSTRTVPISFFSKHGQKSFVQKEGFLAQKIKAGGLIGIVILALGFFALLVVFIRMKLLSKHKVKNPSQLRKVVTLIQKNQVEDAEKQISSAKKDSWFLFVEDLLAHRSSPDEIYETVVMERIAKIQRNVSRFGPVLLVIAGVAPLLGLLGTVTGMIGTFEMITEHGTGNPKLLSGGIKEALVTTQLGLVVAIPCILAGNWLGQWSNRIVSDFEELASSLPRSVALNSEKKTAKV